MLFSITAGPSLLQTPFSQFSYHSQHPGPSFALSLTDSNLNLPEIDSTLDPPKVLASPPSNQLKFA
jgi:hypothetical protein